MCLTRNPMLFYTLGLLLAGCTDVTEPLPTGFSSTPIIQDDAMALRQWDQVTSIYANGTSVSNPIYFNYTARRDVPDGENIFSGPVIFTCQTIALPVLMIITPPWEEVVWRGVYTPPTYTAVPATPDDAAGYVGPKY
jgi:hypothetical protein